MPGKSGRAFCCPARGGEQARTWRIPGFLWAAVLRGRRAAPTVGEDRPGGLEVCARATNNGFFRHRMNPAPRPGAWTSWPHGESRTGYEAVARMNPPGTAGTCLNGCPARSLPGTSNRLPERRISALRCRVVGHWQPLRPMDVADHEDAPSPTIEVRSPAKIHPGSACWTRTPCSRIISSPRVALKQGLRGSPGTGRTAPGRPFGIGDSQPAARRWPKPCLGTKLGRRRVERLHLQFAEAFR